MKAKTIDVLVIGALLGGGCLTAEAALTTNNWTVGAGKWEIGSDWDHGVPSLAHSAETIFSGFPAGGGIVGIDNTTVVSNLINNCMTISNLTVGSSGGMNFYTLAITNAILGTPLIVLNSLNIGSHGSVSVSNAALRVDTLSFVSRLNDDGNVTLDGGGTIFCTNVTIGNTGFGRFTVLDGAWQGRQVVLGLQTGSQGTLTIAGGTVTLDNGFLTIGDFGAGAMWLTGGQLISTNSGTDIGLDGPGQVMVSNGTWQSSTVFVSATSNGTLTVAGGTVSVGFSLYVGAGVNSTGLTWITGGQLLVANSGNATVGYIGTGQMTVSNGASFSAPVLHVAQNATAHGAFTIAGGSATISSEVRVGVQSNSTGAVWLSGGQLSGQPQMFIGDQGGGQLTVSNGTLRAGQTFVANGAGSQGTLTLAGGASTFFNLVIAQGDGTTGTVWVTGGSGSVYSFMNLGNLECALNASVIINGGSLFVTNAAHNAVLDVRDGDLRILSGTLVVDTLIMTNPCGHLVRNGGTLSITSTNLDPNLDADGDGLPNDWELSHGFDPFDVTTGEQDADGDGVDNFVEYWMDTDPYDPHDPFRVIAIGRETNNIRVTWQYVPPPGSDYQHCVVEASPTVTGTWNNISGTITLPPDYFITATTNFVETGGATNKPARFYRVRLVP